MADQPVPFDVGTIPALADLAEDVRRTGRARALERNGETIAYLEPGPRTAKRRPRGRRRSKTNPDTLLGLIAIGDSLKDRPPGPGDVAQNKQQYLAEGYRPTDERRLDR